MKWWHWLVLELLIIFGVIFWIYFFPGEIEDNFSKILLGFMLIYAVDKYRETNWRNKKMIREVEVDGVFDLVGSGLSSEEFQKKLLEFLDSVGVSFGGTFYDLNEKGDRV